LEEVISPHGSFAVYEEVYQYVIRRYFFYLLRKCLQKNLLHVKCEDEDKLEEKMMSKDEDEE